MYNGSRGLSVEMITAILEDKKGFRKSMDIGKWMPYIKIALPSDLPLVSYVGDADGEVQFGQLEFHFIKFLDDDSTVASYKER